MGESSHAQGRAGAPVLLHYRPWRGSFAAPAWSVWPIARTALAMMFRRKLFWALYALGMMVFLLFFFGQYLVAFSDAVPNPGNAYGRPGGLRQLIHRALSFLDGSGDTYLTFIRYQGYIVMIVLALAGSVIVGNDLRFGSLPYYLSKPTTPALYLLGKGLAVAVFINLMTTVPALVLWVEFALLYPGTYPTSQAHLLLGILGYGLVLTAVLPLVLLATTLWVRRTVPLIMVWSTLFIFLRVLSEALVDRLRFTPRFRLLDLWNDASLVGGYFLGQAHKQASGGGQPAWYEALAVLLGVSLLCLIYAIRRIRAVDTLR